MLGAKYFNLMGQWLNKVSIWRLWSESTRIKSSLWVLGFSLCYLYCVCVHASYLYKCTSKCIYMSQCYLCSSVCVCTASVSTSKTIHAMNNTPLIFYLGQLSPFIPPTLLLWPHIPAVKWTEKVSVSSSQCDHPHFISIVSLASILFSVCLFVELDLIYMFSIDIWIGSTKSLYFLLRLISWNLDIPMPPPNTF